MPITFNGGTPTPVNPGDFIQNQGGTVQVATYKISGSGAHGDPNTDPKASDLSSDNVHFINNGDDIKSNLSAETLLAQVISTSHNLMKIDFAPLPGFNTRFQGEAYQFVSKLLADLAPTDPTGVVRLEDLISGPIPGVPSIAPGPALGGGTAQIFGNNFMGEILLTMGAAPVPNDILCTISFGGGASYVSAATPVISPAQAGTDKNGIALVGVLGLTTGWTLSCNAIALDAAPQTYRFNYICGGVN